MSKIAAFSFLFILLSLVSCTHAPIGPEYVIPGSSFRMSEPFTPAFSEISLDESKQFFNAQFSEKVSWTITLEGESSKAVAVISGLSEKIDAVNSIWNGKNDGIHFFRTEVVKATLSFPGSSIKESTSFKIVSLPKNEEAEKMGNGFENFTYNSAEWEYSPYPETVGKLTSEVSVHGKYSMKISGVDSDKDYYVGTVRRPYKSNSLPLDPSQVFLNVYVFGKGNGSSKLKLSANEDDDRSGAFQEDKEDSWGYEFALDHTGWKLISVPYSSFIRSSQKQFGGNGNNMKEPHKISGVDFVLLTGRPGSPAEAIIDYPIITKGAPFVP